MAVFSRHPLSRTESPTFDGIADQRRIQNGTNCSWCYIGKTGRAFNTRKKEHLRNTKTAAKGSRIANHAWSNNHAIDFENALVIDKGTFRTRKTLEAWHTTVTPNADNNSCPLPGQYNILFNKYS